MKTIHYNKYHQLAVACVGNAIRDKLPHTLVRWQISKDGLKSILVIDDEIWTFEMVQTMETTIVNKQNGVVCRFEFTPFFNPRVRTAAVVNACMSDWYSTSSNGAVPVMPAKPPEKMHVYLHEFMEIMSNTLKNRFNALINGFEDTEWRLSSKFRIQKALNGMHISWNTPAKKGVISIRLRESDALTIIDDFLTTPYDDWEMASTGSIPMGAKDIVNAVFYEGFKKYIVEGAEYIDYP